MVVMVIFLFLRISLPRDPQSGAAVLHHRHFPIMYLLHYSLDNLSMMALILSIGFVVDERHRDARKHFPSHWNGRAAAPGCPHRIEGNRFHHRVMTLSLAAVFIPVLFMGGILGRACSASFQSPFCVAILISGVGVRYSDAVLCSRS